MANQAKVAAIYAELQLSTAKFKAALGDAEGQAKRFSTEMRKSTEEAKGSIALLGEQIGVVVPRHLRTFVAGLPGVSAAMSAAFNAVAVFALIDVVVKAGEKLQEFIKKNEEAARKNAAAWTSLHVSVTTQNDDLELTKAKLENAIARLEHKPENKLAEAIAEARVEADKLGDKIDQVVKQIQEAVKGEESGTLSQLLLHQTGGTKTAKVIEDLQLKLSDIDNGYTKGDPTQLRQQALAEARKALAPIIQASHATVAQLQANGTPLEHSSSRVEYEAASQADRNISGLLSVSSNTQQVGVLQNKLNGLQQAKDANAALEQEDAKRLKAFEATLAREKTLYGMSAAQERAYWESKLKELHSGTGTYNSAMEKFAQSSEQLSKQFEKIRHSTVGENNAAPIIGLDQNRGSDQLAAANAKRIEQQAQLNAEWTAAADKLGLLNGTVSAHQAAMDEASAHAEEYRIKIAALQEQLKQLQDEGALGDVLGGDPENRAKQIAVQSQIDALQSKARIEQLTDAQNVLSTTWKGMVDSVFDELIRKSQQTQQQVQQITLHFVDGINSELAKGITGNKMDFSKVFESSAQSLAKTGLEKLEGSALKAFGLGSKRDGSSEASALWVQMAGTGLPKVVGPGGVNTGGLGKGLLGMLNDSNWASSLFGGKLFGAGGIFGGFATGGDVTYGGVYPVGELGPEQVYLPGGSHVVPNKDLQSSPSVGYIDARGTDPVQTQMAVARGMRAAYSHAVADAQRSMSDRARRRPQ